MTEDVDKLVLEGTVTLEDLEELKGRVLTALDAAGALTLDLSGVNHADIAFLQFLISTNLEALKREAQLSFTGEANEMIAELAASAGFIAPKEAPEGWPW